MRAAIRCFVSPVRRYPPLYSASGIGSSGSLTSHFVGPVKVQVSGHQCHLRSCKTSTGVVHLQMMRLNRSGFAGGS
jgi:hypothetical protein